MGSNPILIGIAFRNAADWAQVNLPLRSHLPYVGRLRWPVAAPPPVQELPVYCLWLNITTTEPNAPARKEAVEDGKVLVFLFPPRPTFG